MLKIAMETINLKLKALHDLRMQLHRQITNHKSDGKSLSTWL